jgi:hypothetical protein
MSALVSASQISTFDDCQRKWAWRYIAKIETPPHPSAVLGTEVHDTQLAPYLRDGRAFDYTRDSGHIAAAGLAYLPTPQLPGLVVERHFEMPSPTHLFGYQGYIDLWVPDSEMLPGLGVYNAPAVVDFKTTSDLKWAKTPETLATDVQAQLYATWAMFSTGARTVDLVWIYMQTRGAHKARRVHLRVNGEQVFEQFKVIDRKGLAIHNIRKDADGKDADTYPLTLPPNPSACNSYGGCPYQHKCNLSPSEFIESLSPKETIMSANSLLERMKAKRTQVVGINPPESQLPPAPPVNVVVAPAETQPVKEVDAADPAKRGRPAGKQKKETAAGATIKVTWGKETFQPIPFNTFEVGPFEATASVQDGESVEDAYRRVYGELEAFAAKVRKQKAASYAEELGKAVR